MIYSKVLELISVFNEASEEVDGIVCVDGKGVWGNGMPNIQLSKADALIEIAGMFGATVDIVETVHDGIATVRAECVTDGVAFRVYLLTDAELTAIHAYNRAIINERKEEFRKEMQK